jgi:hypothetical protein
MRRLSHTVVPLLVLTLAACASQTWVKPGVEESQVRADHRECVRLAQPAVDREARIESDIMSTRGDDYRRSGMMATRRNVAEARTSGRQDDVVYSCMRSRGYVLGSEAAAAK